MPFGPMTQVVGRTNFLSQIVNFYCQPETRSPLTWDT